MGIPESVTGVSSSLTTKILLATGLVAVLSISACSPSIAGKGMLNLAPKPATGYITQLEAQTLSLRTLDNKHQYLFSIVNPPVDQEFLTQHMNNRIPVKIVYRAEGSTLVPISISEDVTDPPGQPRG